MSGRDESRWQQIVVTEPRVTPRIYLAGLAMQALNANGFCDAQYVAKRAVEQADAVLQALAAGTPA
jgi:hypothetical protein